MIKEVRTAYAVQQQQEQQEKERQGREQEAVRQERQRADEARAQEASRLAKEQELAAISASPVKTGGVGATSSGPPPPEVVESVPVWQRWWLWAGVGVVVVGAVGVGWMLTRDDTPKKATAPATSLGGIDRSLVRAWTW